MLNRLLLAHRQQTIQIFPGRIRENSEPLSRLHDFVAIFFLLQNVKRGAIYRTKKISFNPKIIIKGMLM